MKKKQKKYLLTRFGGIGDSAPVMVVAKQLKKQGHHVTLALREDDHGVRQIDLLENTDCCDVALTFKEVGPWKTRCVKFKHGVIDVRGVYDQYDQIIDFMNIVEYNDTCKSSYIVKPEDEWKKHRNSNWQNWYDLHLAWANIDPTSVSDEEKRPEYKLSDKEIKEVKKIKKGYSSVITINPNASSLARTWYQAAELVPKLIEEYDNPIIFFWKPDKAHYEVFDREGVRTYQSPFKSSLRASMCVVGASDVYIGADTGFTHIAEGLDIPNIAIYSSVPAWTRAKYYKHQVSIDKGPHSFALTLGDPARVQEGLDNLSTREKKLEKLHKSGMTIEEAAKALNSTPEGVNLEMRALKTKIESFERIQSKSLSKVTQEEVLQHVREHLLEGVLG